MPKKHKKVTKVTKKVVNREINSPVSFLFHRYDNNVAFTLVVSCAAYAIFMMVNMVLQQTNSVILQQEQQLAAIHSVEMGQVAGVADVKE